MEVIVFVGLQGAGKSTFYQRYFAETYAHISKDNFPNARDRNAHQQKLLRENLTRHQSVVIDNTNTRVQDRAPLIEIAHSFGAKVLCYYFVSSVRESLVRNRARAGKARVADVAIFVAAKRLEEPTYAEGFDKIFHAKIEGEGFKITEIEQSGDGQTSPRARGG